MADGDLVYEQRLTLCIMHLQDMATQSKINSKEQLASQPSKVSTKKAPASHQTQHASAPEAVALAVNIREEANKVDNKVTPDTTNVDLNGTNADAEHTNEKDASSYVSNGSSKSCRADTGTPQTDAGMLHIDTGSPQIDTGTSQATNNSVTAIKGADLTTPWKCEHLYDALAGTAIMLCVRLRAFKEFNKALDKLRCVYVYVCVFMCMYVGLNETLP
jgi:hypothetical protein